MTEVTQADCKAAAAYIRENGGSFAEYTASVFERGEHDDSKLVQAFARHRTAAVKPLVEALEAHIRNNEEPLEAMTEVMVAAIEAWKLNDEKAIDKAIHDGLARIAQSVASFTVEMLR